MKWLYLLSVFLIGYLEGCLGLWEEVPFWAMVTLGRVAVGLLVLLISYQLFYLLLPAALVALLFWDGTLFAGLGVSALLPLALYRSSSQAIGFMLAAYIFGIGVGEFAYAIQEVYWIAISVFLLHGITMICDRHPHQDEPNE